MKLIILVVIYILVTSGCSSTPVKLMKPGEEQEIKSSEARCWAWDDQRSFKCNHKS